MSDVNDRNWQAVLQTLKDQDKKLADYERRLTAISVQLRMMHDELERLKQKNMAELVSQFGSGPTAGG